MNEDELKAIERRMEADISAPYGMRLESWPNDMRALIAEVRRRNDEDEDERPINCSPEELQRLQREINELRSRAIIALPASPKQ